MASGSRTKSRNSKAEQARQTRQRIVAAATALFVRDGFLTTTMATIAAEAGVAVQTLYLSFGSKTAILGSAFDTAIAGDDEPVPIMQREWMQELRQNPDGVAALTSFVDTGGAVVERASALYEVIRAAAADPEVAELLANNKKERRDGYSAVVDSLSSKPGFTKKLTIAEATGVLYAVQSEETYALLVHEHGWTPRQWHDWVLRTMLAELFPGAGSRAGQRRDPRRSP